MQHNNLSGLLFQLLQSGLHPDNRPSLHAEVSAETWKALYRLCITHGVTAIVLEGIRKLPVHLQPDKKIMIGWVLQSENIETRHFKLLKVARELTQRFDRAGIGALLLKGVGLSRFYPIPFLREYGDIDFYLTGNFEKGKEILTDAGAKLLRDVPKHAEYFLFGMTIELHRTILNVSRNTVEASLNQLLCEQLEKEMRRDMEGIHTPGATFNAIYLIRHAALHFLKEGLPMRQLCDWNCFLERCGNEVEWALFDRTMEHFGMDRFADTMTAAAIYCCGLDWPLPSVKAQNLARFIDDLLIYNAKKPSMHRLSRVIRKIVAPWHNRWRFGLLRTSLTGYYFETLRAQWHEKFTLLR